MPHNATLPNRFRALNSRAAARLALTSTLLPLACGAQGDTRPDGLSGSIGLGVAATRTYEGSAQRKTLTGPDFELSYRTRHLGTLALGTTGLTWVPFDQAELQLGLVLGYDPGRKTHRTPVADPTPGDTRLAGLGEVRGSAEVGLMLAFGPASLVAHTSPGQRGHRGTQVDLRAAWPWQLSDRLGLRAGGGLVWADQHYLQTYFGVTAAQSAASGFRPFTPRSGVRRGELNLGAEYTLGPTWKARAAVAWSRLQADAAASPLVARRADTVVSASVVASF